MTNSKDYIKNYIIKARRAQQEFETYSQEQVDSIVRAAAKAVYDNAEMLARLAVDETSMGVYEDKVAKNKMKSKIIWNSLRGKKSVGILSHDEKTGITEIAKPIGIVAAITPTTNPNVTPMSNAMFALKGRNAIIITPHHRSVKSSTLTVELINEALKKLGAPEHLVQILDQQSRENTKQLIESVDLIIATGGSFFNGLTPTNTLGCGSWGNNSISENLGYKHLINVSRIGYFMKDNIVPTDQELWAE